MVRAATPQSLQKSVITPLSRGAALAKTFVERWHPPDSHTLMHRPGFLRLSLLALLLTPLGCDEVAAPVEAVDESELTFVQVAPDAPKLNSEVVTFWTSKTEDRQGQLVYTSEGYNGKCMRFVVPAGSVEGPDSVKITVRLVDERFFSFQFEPAGTKFDPAKPARLEVRYKWANPDLNGDGQYDQIDEEMARNFGFWRQERVGEPWVKVPTTRSETELEAATPVTGFTRYALATS
jgi:hypothetical protein